MSSGTVRISETARNSLRELSKRTGESMQNILDRAIEDYRRRCLLDEANRAYSRLREDPEAWAEEQAERAAWDQTLRDGLEQ